MKHEPIGNQRLAIDARGSTLVSAAAGSGKTFVLSRRAVARMTDPVDPIDVNDMLIVTFTNAAAAEMRQRISADLSEHIAEHGDDRVARRQKAYLDTAAICTIDAFCIDLVRENFADPAVGVRPDFRVMSEERMPLLLERIAGETLTDLMQSRPAEFRAMTASLWKDGSFDSAVNGLIDLYQFTQVMPYPKEWLRRVIRDYEEDLPFNDRAWVRELLRSTLDRADYALTQIRYALTLIREDAYLSAWKEAAFEETAAQLCRVCDAARSGDYDAVREAIRAVTFPDMRYRKNEGDPTLKPDPAIQKAVTAAKNAASSWIGGKDTEGEKKRYFESAADQQAHLRAVGAAVKTFCECEIAFYGRLLEQMKQENSYDFNAIEHMALDLLCVCREGKPVPRGGDLNRRYREVMVDEYQDTNDLQDAIFHALSDGGKRLFLVGDVKQCIYRFRRANPGNFIRKRDELPSFVPGADSARIDLSGNLRSSPEVCDYVNHTFRLLMTREAADMDYEKEDELIPMGKGFVPAPDPAVALHLVKTQEDSVAEEAAYVAQALRKAHDEGMTVSVWDRDKGERTQRPLKWSDVLILVRTVKGKNMTARSYVEALEKAGIPADADTKDDLNACEEIRLLLSLLRAVDNPLRDVPLLATLMSPMFGFSADEIARIRLRGPDAPLYGALVKDAETSPGTRAFLNRLDRYRRWVGTLPADRLIRRIIDDVGLSAIAYRLENGAHAHANLMLFIDHAARYEAEGFRGLTAFLRFWDRLIKQGETVDCAASLPGKDAVRVLSIHKSKGLEAPVVILADTAKQINQMDSRKTMAFDEIYGIGTKYFDDENAVAYDTVAHAVVTAKDRRDTNAEELRLLYVAMTRAQDRLWLIVRAKDPDKALKTAAASLSSGWGSREDPIDPLVVSSTARFSDWLLMTALLHPDAAPLRETSGKALMPTSSPGRLQIAAVTAPAETDRTEAAIAQEERDFSPYLNYVYPYRDLLRFESKYSVSQLAKGDRRDDESCTSRPAFITGDRLTPAEKGTATHCFMCFADYERARNGVRAEIDRLVSEGRLTREQGDGIDVPTVEAFFGSDLFNRVRSAERVLRESRFLYEMPVRRLDPACASDETVVVQGVADLVLIESDGVTVVDFKTDRNCTPEELIGRYARQLEIYTDAFAADYGLVKKTPYLYSFFLKRAVPVPGIADPGEKK